LEAGEARQWHRGVRTILKSKPKQSHGSQYWHIWLRTGKQRLAAFTILLMMALGLIAGRPAAIRQADPDQEHAHVESELAGWASGTSSRRIREDSGATAAFVNTGAVVLLWNGLNVVTNDDVREAAGRRCH
jgi:hypothetical protein